MSPSHEGQILTSYDRQILAAAISADDGQTWSGYREIARIHSDTRAVSYPFLTETQGDAFFCVVHGEAVRVPLGWLTENRIQETFREGLSRWMTVGCEGADLVPHPQRGDA